MRIYLPTRGTGTIGALLAMLLILAAQLSAQANNGEVRLQITDPAGAPIVAYIQMSGPAMANAMSLSSNEAGALVVRHLAFGTYKLQVSHLGFAPFTTNFEVRSAAPVQLTVPLRVATQFSQITVTDNGIRAATSNSSSVQRIGVEEIEQRVSSLPGRSIQDLVLSQPGWLFEGSAVLHPRGAENQAQFVVDGIPLTDNRSPGLGPEIGVDDVESVVIYTSGFPAEYGRKMGGVIELNSRYQAGPGLHGQFAIAGGSYHTGSGYGQVQGAWGKNLLGISGSVDSTQHYLNPVVPQNYSNTGTTNDWSVYLDRNLSATESVRISVRHEGSRYLVPNELVQQLAGQQQHGDNHETAGTIIFQHILSPNSLATFSGMVRENNNGLNSNQESTPIIAFHRNEFFEGYFKGTLSVHHGRHELKAGVESDAFSLHENFHYALSDPSQFDEQTPASFSFAAQRPDLEQAAFAEDLLSLHAWSIRAGLRWDHYQLLTNENALTPRLTVGRYLPRLGTVLHASVDKLFNTPAIENILISGTPQIEALNNQFLRLPVRPSRGYSYEAGLATNIFDRAQLKANVYRRALRNYADDNNLLNTGISYPIAFDKAVIYGAEGKLELLSEKRLSGFVSYSWMVGNVWFPVTGGLFLGSDAADALGHGTGHFPGSQDQRNTVATRFLYRVTPRIWIASGAAYGSGLPFEFEGAKEDALAQYGSAVIDRLNFDRGRIRPSLAINSSIGVNLYNHDKKVWRLQADADNLNDRLNVIDFAGLFSGNAIGPARSFMARLTVKF